jgi:8-oxo-dGTP pyrophosphatase MutT (NUDIX family)
LVAIIANHQKVYTGIKSKFYPPGITRLLGGGINKNESPTQAAIREISEETKLKITPQKLQQIALFHISATDENNKTYCNKTIVFKYPIGVQKAKNGDDIDGLKLLSFNELEQLGIAYKSLNETLWFVNLEYFGGLMARLGKIYGSIHQEVAKILKTF